MAYGVRWFSEFDDIHENVVYRVEIRERDYAGAATEVLSEGTEPLVLDMAKVENVFIPLRPQKATVRWMAQEGIDFQISDLFIDDDRKYQLHVFEEDGETLKPKFTGWVVPIELEEPFSSKPYPVTFSATCGLPFLSDDYVLDGFGSFVLGEKTLAEVIANCLTSTGLELEIDTYVSLLAEGMSDGSPFPQAEIDADGLRGKFADEVLAGILAPFRAYITQSNGRWVIKGLIEQNALESTRVRFSPDGSVIGTETVNQSAGIGRTAYTSGSHLRPTAEVVEKIAEPNSIVTNAVSPGIPVNRLPNGLFAGAITGGTIPGWNNHIGSIPWARMGFNKPDDPYRLEMYQHIEFDPKKKKRAFKPFVYFDSGPIYLNLGDFNIPEDRRKETKVVLSGAFKSNNSLSATFMLSINETEREYNSYLDDNGEWFYSKKEDKTYNKRSNQAKYEPESKSYEDLELQTFEIESKKITNYLNRPEGAVVVLRLRIFPAIQGPGYIGGNIFYSLEDLALIVVEDTVYEGDHKYQIDAHLPIRNANEVEYTSIIADKIDITTPEQSRDVNRVMTGYMTLAGSGALTTGWKYSGMVNYTPIQKLSLSTSLRQLAGKRRTLDGNFLGYDVTPDISIFNRYDQPGIPSTFYAQTAWRWNVKDGTYDISATELNVFPLPTEDLYLYDDESGRRGNRMYRGNSSAGSGGNSPTPAEPIVMGAEPVVYFTVGKQEIKVVNIGELIESIHTPVELTVTSIHWDMPSHVGIDRGDDGLGLSVLITAKPKEAGTDRVQIYLISADGDKYIFLINLISFAAPKAKYTLYDTTSGEVLLGEITQGAGFLKPDSWKVKVNYTGFHEAYFASMNGPGLVSNVTPYPYLPIEQMDSYDYVYYLPASGSYISGVGTHNMEFATFRNEGDPDAYAEIKRDSIKFILYDEEYLSKVKFELWVGGSKFGDIAADGSSEFNTEGQAFQVKIIVEGLPHDLATAILTSGGEDVKTHVYTQDPAVEDVEYELYESTPAPQPEGLYELNFSTSDEVTETVYDRLVAFTINKKKVAPTGGELQLVAMRANQSAYDVIGSLGLSGGLFDLPATGWNVALPGEIAEGTTRSVVLLQKKGENLVSVNIELYTGQPQVTEPTGDQFLIFGTLSSKNIDKIHVDPSSFRVTVTDEVDGEIVAVYAADFSFGVLEDLDDLEVSEPGNAGEGVQEYYAGRGLSEIVDDYIKTFNVNTDGVTLEIFDQTNPAVNWLRIKDKGVTFVKMQDIASLSLIGKLTAGSGSPYEVPVLNGASGAAASDTTIGTTLWVKNQLTGAVSGLAGRVAKFATNTTLTYSILEESGISLIARQGIFVADNVSNTNVRGFAVQEGGSTRFSFGKLGAGADFAFWRFADNGATVLGTPIGIERATGKVTLETQLTIQGASLPPLVVSSTALVTNFNADLLDGQHGAYYLARANHTGTQLASTISDFSPAVLATTLAGLSNSNSSITSSDTILQAFGKIQGQITGNISGTVGRLAKFTGTNAIGTSILEESGIALTAREGIFVSDHTSNTNVRGFVVQEGGSTRFSFGKLGAGADFAFWRYADNGATVLGTPIGIERATGKVTLETQLTINASGIAPLVVDSSVLVTNLNADLLDGQHGSYYLNWDNFTNIKSVLAGNGMTGGGALTSNVTLTLGTPSTLDASTSNSVSGSTHTHAITTGNLVQGSNVSLSGTLTNRLIGSGNVTIAAVSMPWSGVTGTPTTLSGFGIVDAPTTVYVDTQLGGKENTFSKGNLIQGSGISLSGTLTNRLVGSGDVTISISGGLSGSGTNGYFAKWTGSSSLGISVMQDTGSEINIANTRSLGVEGPAAMRDYLHVWGYCNMGTSSNHGTLLIHKANSGTIDGAAAFEVRSTEKGLLLPRMTASQMTGIPSAPAGLLVFQTDAGSSGTGVYACYGGGVWLRCLPDL